MDKHVAVYICQGCDIGASLDLDALETVATDECSATSCHRHPCLCGAEGRTLLTDGIKEGAQALVVAACSPRTMTDAFRFDGTLTERVNLREQVVWSHEPNDEDTQMLAEDYLRMGIAHVQHAELPEPLETDIDKTILVVGGGITGLTAALNAAGAGHAVVLVEKAEHLGGWLGRFSKGIPHRPPYREPADTSYLTDMIAAVEGHEHITVLTGATIDRITGQPGQFDVAVRANGSSGTHRVGAIVQATGWKPYDAAKLGHLGYGQSPDVITNVQMEELLATGALTRPSDGAPIRRVAFIQCAGSRDKNHLPYCSAVCCRVTIKQALQLRALSEDVEAYVLYKDIRTPGQYEDFYRRAQEDDGIFFTKAEVTGVVTDGPGLAVEAEQTLLGEKIRVEADLVVLATGMVPAAADGEALRRLTDAKAVIAAGKTGVQLEAAQATVAELQAIEGTEILNLDYRQGPDLPGFRYGFADSHFICFPYETRRTGIYAAGCVRAPLDGQLCVEDGAGAVLKAISSLVLADRGAAVQPRLGDRSYPDFALQRCTQCKRCTEECPFGTLNEDVKGTPLPNLTRCRRCGICMGACPERIISFTDYSVEMLSSMIKAVNIPDEFEEKPRLLGLICENDAYPALDTAGLQRIRHSPYIRFIPVRCLGSVNVVFVADALARGYDGIIMIGCKSGDDYQCHFIRGSELMGTRSTNIRDKLKQLALEEERVRIEELSIADFERLPAIINEFAAEIEEMGMNPFKGF